MKKSKQPNKGSSKDWTHYFVDEPHTQDRLRAYFSRVEQGTDAIYRTNFGGKDVPISQILGPWLSVLREATLPEGLLEFEEDLASKVGPMSVMKPLRERIADIDHYYEDILRPSTPISDEAVEAVLHRWNGVYGLRPKSQMDTLDEMKLSTSSGSPYFTRRSRVVNKTVPVRNVDPDNHQYRLNGSNWSYCAILGWRGQEGGPKKSDVKQRVVWMFPFGVNVLELSIYQPLIQGAQATGLVPAWVSNDLVDERITQLFDTKDPKDLVICTDFSKFDQHFNADMQECSLRILHGLSSDPGWNEAVDLMHPIKYNIPLAFDWEDIRYGPHGMGSGSGGTNADETLSHSALQYEAALSQNQELNPNSMCLGDDGILSYPGITTAHIVKSYSQHGQEMNATKQMEATDKCVYLRRFHHRDYRVDGKCVGIYSTCRALGRLMEQERFYDPEIWGPKAVALRQLSILENVKYHPLREQFVHYCMRRDKYRLGLDIPNFFSEIATIADEYTAIMPDFLGYTRSQMDGEMGIQNWWIVKYLTSL